MSLLAKVKRPGPVPPSRLHGPHLALYNTIACCYPQDIIRKIRQTRKLHSSIYHELFYALKSAQEKSAYHLPTLIQQLPKHVAATAVTALASLGFAAAPGFGAKPVIFFEEERERLWEVVTRLLENDAMEPERLESLVERGLVSDEFDAIDALYQIRWQMAAERGKHSNNELANPAYKWYHRQPLGDVHHFLSMLQPVAKQFGYEPPLRIRGYV